MNGIKQSHIVRSKPLRQNLDPGNTLQDRHPLAETSKAYGSGVYAIYYTGDAKIYAPISGTETPICVGKADPPANAKTVIEQLTKLTDRLGEHRKNIDKVSGIELADFECRALAVQSGYQASAEIHLIRLFEPIWNNETRILFGLGKHGVGDPAALPSLLDQVDGPVDLFLSDGAYDGNATRNLLRERFGPEIDVTIPPPKNAALSLNAVQNPTVRDRQITDIAAHGRMAWQKTSGYNQRSRIETPMGRWKAVIGPKLKARSLEDQKSEAKIGVRVLNRMTELGRPNSERAA